MAEFDGLEVIPGKEAPAQVATETVLPPVKEKPVVDHKDNLEVIPPGAKEQKETATKKATTKPVAETVAAPVANPVVETTETTQPPATPTKASKKADLLKEMGITSPQATAEPQKPAVELPADVNKELNELRAIASNKAVQAILAAEKQGKNIFSVVDELKGQDPKSMPLDELFKIELDRLGIKDEDEVALELEKFGEKTKSEQLKTVMPIRELLEKQREDKLNEFISQSASSQIQTEQKIQTTIQEYQSNLTNLMGKKILGIEITPDIAKEIGEINVYAQSGDTPVSAQDLLELNLFHKYKHIVVNTLVEKGIEAGVDFMEKKLNMTGPDTSGTSLPQPGVGSGVQQRISNLNSTLSELYPEGKQ